ncbi:MAG: glycosyltransferase family 4 protein [Planctomycetota bacterium]
MKHKDNNLRRSLGWDGRFVVLYSGNAGFVHRFEELCGAMRRLAIEDPDVLFAFVGGGPRRAEIESFAKEWRLQNASFLPYFPRESLGLSLPAADAHFLSLRREHVGVSVPGKLYGQLASGRPVLFVGPTRCETAEDVSASGAGIVVGHGDANGLADAILRLKRNPDLVARMGAAGREWFLLNRERVASCEMWRRLLEDVAAGRPVERKRRPARGASSPKRAATRAA